VTGQLCVENSALSGCITLQQKRFRLSVHFYMILPATLSALLPTGPLCAYERSPCTKSGVFFFLAGSVFGVRDARHDAKVNIGRLIRSYGRRRTLR